ncbi:MAG TPA: glycosyltransferase [Candidatus Deferrimicrobium sp.]|nr:glycosyltransferase [Candidatus Deferrimicrobium sp.]
MIRVVMYVFNDARNDARVMREAASLAAAGHEVTVMARAANGAPLPDREVRDGVTIVRIPVPTRSRLLWQWLRAPWTLRRPWFDAVRGSLRRRRSPVESAAAVGWLAVLGLASLPWLAIRLSTHLVLSRARPAAGSSDLDWLAWWRLVVLAWAGSAAAAAPPSDVQHGHDLSGLEAAGRARRRLGGRLVYDSHEVFVEAGSAALRSRVIKSLLSRSERAWSRGAVALVTVNDSVARELGRRLRPARTVVVHNAPERWDPPATPPDLIRAATGIPAASPITLYHGGFSAHRGLEELAAAILEPRMDRVHAVYLGYGAMRQDLDRLAADARFGGRLHVLDAVPSGDLGRWIASADVGVMVIQPSTLNHRLSTPNKLFECLAAGIPVVASDFPEMRSIVCDDPLGPLGEVCPPADPAAIARAIRSIIERSPDERTILRARCLAAAHGRWNWETEVAGLIALYSDLEAAA